MYWISRASGVNFVVGRICIQQHIDTIGMAPYDILYGRKCRSPSYWYEIGKMKLMDPDMVHEMAKFVMPIRRQIQIAPDRLGKQISRTKFL